MQKWSWHKYLKINKYRKGKGSDSPRTLLVAAKKDIWISEILPQGRPN